MTRPEAWTRQELAILADVYPREGVNGAAEVLADRSPQAIQQKAHKLGIASCHVGDAPKPILAGAELERAITLYEGGAKFMAIARELGVSDAAATNAILIALCPRRGYRPAERDDTGRLTAESKERLRYMLKKGLKHVDIQLRLGVSASCVHKARREYDRDLVARGKAPLPPPGGGEQYSGVRIPRATIRAAEALFLEGYGSPAVAKRTGISAPGAKRLRTKLIKRLARKGETLPGCDLTGKRIAAAKVSRHFIPAAIADALRVRLLAGEPVARAAKAVAIGSCSAYRIRDEFAAELAARDEQLPRPKRLGRGDAAKVANLETNWLPAGRMQEYRDLVHAHGPADAKRLLLERVDQERAVAAAARAAERARPKTLEEQLARLARGEARVVANIPLRRPDYAGTLGGIASAAL